MPFKYKHREKEYKHTYYLKNKGRDAEKRKSYYFKNREKYSKLSKEREKRLKAEDPEKYRLDMNKRIQRYRQTVGGKYRAVYLNAKSRGIEVLFTCEQFKKWWKDTPEKCEYCSIDGKNLFLFKKQFSSTDRFTIDRLNSDKPYSLDNIVKSCSVCNRVKGNIFTPEIMRKIGIKYVKPIWLRKIVEDL